MKCKICGEESRLVMEGTLMGRHAVQYFGCARCGFLQTQEPHWLAEAYAQPINRSDVGYVSRNLAFAEVTSTLLDIAFARESRSVDFGGGYGLFVRLMRDKGHHFSRLDKYCANLFAPDFEADARPGCRYDLLTAFELFEHLDDPGPEIEKMLQLSDSILFSTELIPEPYPLLDEWKYYGLEHGQHVAFYSRRTVEFLAKRHGLFFRSSSSHSLHLFSRQPITKWRWIAAQRNKARMLLSLFLPRRVSLMMSDYRDVVSKIRGDIR